MGNSIIKNSKSNQNQSVDKPLTIKPQQPHPIKKASKNIKTEPSYQLFLGLIDGSFQKLEISEKEITKKTNYGVMYKYGYIHKMALSKNQKSLFIGAYDLCPNVRIRLTYRINGVLQLQKMNRGGVTQWNIQLEKIQKDFGEIHKKGVSSFVITDKDIFTTNYDPNDRTLKQQSLKGNEPLVSKDYKEIHANSIRYIVSTYGNRFLFTIDVYGNLKQWNVKQQIQVKACGLGINGMVSSMICTKDNRFQFIASTNGCLKRYNINSQKRNNYGRIHDGEITCIATSNDCQYLFTGDNLGNFMQWKTKKKSLVLVKHCLAIGRKICSIVVTNDDLYAFTSDIKGVLKQFNIETKSLHKDYGKIELREKNAIMSMAVL